ncbi:PREDICTED: piggyBac transposable element-derived protein 4-like [Cyphomyrmex costatus]|uniref:piggyBac transposable element-derived protein 4-like n=1 Tax=Cyphomyrmex costatus TaxID=456900 RepID=UPI0008523443|nr:PREDICTED: piggyBac transposable element-derived protein 4-like [Cyphomyrmex costatus]
MEELSRAEFARLNAAEKERYLIEILGNDDNESIRTSDSDDDDWVPDEILSERDASDSDEPVDDLAQEIDAPTEEDDEENEDTEEEREEEGEAEAQREDQAAAAARAGETPSTYIAKDKTVWNKTPFYQHQIASHNIIRQRNGPHRSTETLSISNTFKKIFTVHMVDIIIRHTNKKALSVYAAFNAAHPDSKREWKPVTVQEIYSFMAILICSGVNNSNTDHTSDMWHSNSYPLYRATMGLNRFRNILRFIRFDDANTRQQRAKEDKAAPIRDLWTMLNANLSKMYKPTENLTIDEQLYPFRGRTKFTQYIPSKPAKYGIKIWWICDAENAYPLHGIIYTGKTGNVREKNQGERLVKELAAAYRGSGRNITMDNFFTTLPFAKHLLSWKLTLVGTLKKNKPYIPSVMAPNKSREVYSTVFGFHEKVTLCSYVPKKNKAVILISTMHSDMAVNDDAKKKPHIITYYNKYKAGVDTMDQMITRYTTQRRTLRWPLVMFFNILDVTSLACYLIYYENNKMIPRKTNQRRIFLRQLSEELAEPMIVTRSQNVQIMRNYNTKIAIESVIGRIVNPVEATRAVERDVSGRKKVTGSCQICYKQTIRKRRKTRKACSQCNQPVCDEHAITFSKCIECNK